MNKIVSAFLIVIFLSGCSNGKENVDTAMSLREKILTANSCNFKTKISADYQSEYYEFEMNCICDNQGNVSFSVTYPETIAGITGEISNESGKLTFDDKYLVFAPLVDGQITPIGAPWLFMKALRSGFISGCTKVDNGVKIIIDDCYKDSAIQVQIQTNQDNLPTSAEIFWQNRRVVTMVVENFCIV